MAEIRTFNIDGLAKFKQRIKYEQIAASIRDDEKVYLDWPSVLEVMTISGAGTWESAKNTIYSKQGGLGVVSGSLINKAENVKFDIYVFSESDNKAVADQALNLVSQTSKSEINYKLFQYAQADMCIYSSHINESAGYHRIICSFRNVVMRLTASSESVDVKPFAEYLLGKMAVSVVATNRFPKISPRVSVSSGPLKVGDKLWIDIGTGDNVVDDRVEVKIALNGLAEGLEYMGAEGRKYFFLIEKPGSYQVEYIVLDTRYLISASGRYLIQIGQ